MKSEAKTPVKLNVTVSINNNIDGLYSIRKPSVPAVIWRRTPLLKFQTWIDSLSDEQLPSARISLPLNAISEALTEVMQISGTPACVQREMLVDDITALANVFAEINRTKFLRLRLEAITDNKCSKFHMTQSQLASCVPIAGQVHNILFRLMTVTHQISMMFQLVHQLLCEERSGQRRISQVFFTDHRQ